MDDGAYMSYKLEIIKEPNYLLTNIKGNRTTETVKEVTKEILEACIKYQYSKVLIDIREFSNRIGNTMNIFDLASQELPDIIQKKIKKVAIVDLEGFEEDKRFFETVALNRGHNVKIFTDLNKAQEWLL